MSREANKKPRGHVHDVNGCAECTRLYRAAERMGRHLEWSRIQVALESVGDPAAATVRALREEWLRENAEE